MELVRPARAGDGPAMRGPDDTPGSRPGRGANATSNGPPLRPVTSRMASKGVSDLMQHRVTALVLTVEGEQFTGEGETSGVVVTASEPPLASVPGPRPSVVDQVVLSHQRADHRACLVRVHGFTV